MDRLFVLLQRLLPKQFISALTGTLTRLEGGALTHWAIGVFVRAYGVDLSEAARTRPADYRTFNAFFTRALAPGARPLTADPEAVACAADGCISEQGEIDGATLLQAKGVTYTLRDLLDGDDALAALFHGGSFQTIYLAPYNYHRVHMPLSGTLDRLRYTPGALFSVNARTARALPRLFSRNERVAAVFRNGDNWFALIMVGALNVGSIELTVPVGNAFRNRPRASWSATTTHRISGSQQLERGAEFGRFNMGSTVIVLASAGAVEWDPGFRAGSLVRYGERVGRIKAAQ